MKHPKAMTKLEAELDEAGLLVSERNPHPRPFVFEDISRLRYLDQVIKVGCMRSRCKRSMLGQS